MPKIKEVWDEVKTEIKSLLGHVEKDTVEFFSVIITQVDQNGGPKFISIVKEEVATAFAAGGDLGTEIAGAAKRIGERLVTEEIPVVKNAVYAAIAAEIANVAAPK